MSETSHRGTLFLEETEVLTQEAHPGEQYLMRLWAPECAQFARPGQFVHLRCDPALPLRRPISILRVNARESWIEILYKAVGEGTRLLAQKRPGDVISSIGPIGNPFQVHAERPRPLLIGGGVGMPPMIFLADALRREPAFKPLVILGSEVPFPFQARPSQFLVPGLSADVIAAMPLLDDWGIPSRLASLQGYAGGFQGFVTDLARSWLGVLDTSALAEVEVFACGPHPMLAAVAALARECSPGAAPGRA